MSTEGRRLELARFLRDRRERLRPDEVGLPQTGRRRVRGLRREEVAALAGVGLTWYTMLETGAANGVSEETLSAIGRALRLNEAECEYLRELSDPAIRPVPDQRPSPLLCGALAAVSNAPAYICTAQWNVLDWNAAMQVVWGIEAPGGAPFNILRRMFSDEALRALHGERFPQFAHALVGMLRAGLARRFEDPSYHALHDEFAGDPVFAQAWNSYDMTSPTGSLRTEIDSPAVGRFAYEAITLIVPDDSGHSLVIQVPDAESTLRLSRALLARTP